MDHVLLQHGMAAASVTPFTPALRQDRLCDTLWVASGMIEIGSFAVPST